MADRVVPGPVESSAHIREAVCIQTRKIFDSCRDKDCIEDLRVFPTVSSQPYIENAFSIRPKSAELLYARVNVEDFTRLTSRIFTASPVKPSPAEIKSPGFPCSTNG